MYINEKECMKQLKDIILEKGNYSSIEIIVGKEKMPYISVKNQCSGEVLGKAIIALEKTTEKMKKMYRPEYLIAKKMYYVEDQGCTSMD